MTQEKLPDALDLLNLCVESGLVFQAAVTQVATNQTGPVAEEFSVALQEMQGRLFPAVRPSRPWRAGRGRRTSSASCGR